MQFATDQYHVPLQLMPPKGNLFIGRSDYIAALVGQHTENGIGGPGPGPTPLIHKKNNI